MNTQRAVSFRLTPKQARNSSKFIDLIRFALYRPDYYYDVFRQNGTVEVVISDGSFDATKEVDVYCCPTIEGIVNITRKYLK